MDNVAQRRQRLMPVLGEDDLEALLVSNPINVTYLTGFSGDSSYLVLTRERAVLVSDGRFTEQIEQECPGLETHIRPPAKTLYQAGAEVVDKLGVRRVGFESAHLTVRDLETLANLAKTVSWKPEADRVETLRAVKDASEVTQIREAIAIAERALGMFVAMMRPEDTEKEAHDNLEYYMRRAGGRCASFPTIVGVGARAALPHAPPTSKRISEGELLLVDWGASGPFYQSDLTRVFATRKIGPQLAEVYDIVLRAQKEAIAAVRPGIKGHEVDAVARKIIEEAGYGPNFNHGLGHGIGLEIHESPAVRQNSQTKLEAGMVVTIEPGIYLPGWGGVRIEDDVLVIPDGHEVLTHVAKEPIPTLAW